MAPPIQKDVDLDLVALIEGRFQDSAAPHDARLPQWKQAYLNWRSQLNKEKKYPHRAQFFVPKTFAQVETILPRWLSSLLPDEDLITSRPIDNHIDPLVAEVVNRFEAWKLDLLGFGGVAADVLRSAAIFGLGIMGIGISDHADFPGQLGTGYYVDLKQFYPDPSARRLEDAADCFVVREFTLANIIAHVSGSGGELHAGVREDVLEYLARERPAGRVIGGTDTASPQETYQGALGLPAGGYGLSATPGVQTRAQALGLAAGVPERSADLDAGRYQVLWRYLRGGRYQVVVNGLLLWDTGPGFWPFDELPFEDFRAVSDPTSFYGVGIPEAMGTLQHEMNEIHNIRLDALKLGLSPPIIVSSGAGFPLGNVEWFPGRVLTVPGTVGPDNVKMLEYNPRSISVSYQEEMLSLGLADQATGAFDQTRGDFGGGTSDSGSGVAAVIEQGDMRHGAQVKELRRSLRNAYRKMVAIDAVYAAPETVLTVLGALDPGWSETNPRLAPFLAAYVQRRPVIDEKGEPLTDPTRPFTLFDAVRDVSPRPAPAGGNKGIMRQQLLQLAAIAQQFVAADPRLAMELRLSRVFRKLVGAMELDVGEFFVPPAELDAEARSRSEEAAVADANQEILFLVARGKMPPPQPGQEHQVYLMVYEGVLKGQMRDQTLSTEQIAKLIEQAQARRRLLILEQQQRQQGPPSDQERGA